MCPACLATTAITLAGAGAAGGLSFALVLFKRGRAIGGAQSTNFKPKKEQSP